MLVLPPVRLNIVGPRGSTYHGGFHRCPQMSPHTQMCWTSPTATRTRRGTLGKNSAASSKTVRQLSQKVLHLKLCALGSSARGQRCMRGHLPALQLSACLLSAPSSFSFSIRSPHTYLTLISGFLRVRPLPPIAPRVLATDKRPFAALRAAPIAGMMPRSTRCSGRTIHTRATRSCVVQPCTRAPSVRLVAVLP